MIVFYPKVKANLVVSMLMNVNSPYAVKRAKIPH